MSTESTTPWKCWRDWTRDNCRDRSNSHEQNSHHNSVMALSWNAAFTSTPLHILSPTQHTLKRRSRGPQAILYFKKRGMVSGQVMLLYSSYSSFTRAVGVSRRWRDNGGDLSDLSAPIVARHIIDVHLWEKPWPLPRRFCVTLSFCLCWIFSLLSVLLYLHAALTSLCCILAVEHRNHPPEN